MPVIRWLGATDDERVGGANPQRKRADGCLGDRPPA